MTDLYLLTPDAPMSLLTTDRDRLSHFITNLLLTEDWVYLGSNFGGVLASWAVMERDADNFPVVTVFRAGDKAEIVNLRDV